MSDLPIVLRVASALLLVPGLAALLRHRAEMFWLMSAAGSGFDATANALRGEWGWLAWDMAWAAFSVYRCQCERRKRDEHGVPSPGGAR